MSNSPDESASPSKDSAESGEVGLFERWVGGDAGTSEPLPALAYEELRR